MALVLLLCVGGAFVALRGGGDDSACGGDPITVSAAPEIAQPLKEALSKVEEEDDCADFEVSAASSASAAAISGSTSARGWVLMSGVCVTGVPFERGSVRPEGSGALHPSDQAPSSGLRDGGPRPRRPTPAPGSFD